MEDNEEVKQTVNTVIDDLKRRSVDSPIGWVFGLIAVVLAVFTAAVYAFRSWQTGKEIAKLRHEKDVEKEKHHQDLIDIEVAEKVEVIESAIDHAEDAEDKIADIEDKIKAKRAEQAALHEAISQITSWDDVRRLVK